MLEGQVTYLGTRKILNGVGGARFQQEHLRQDNLVIELLQFPQQLLGHAESLPVVLRIDVARLLTMFPK